MDTTSNALRLLSWAIILAVLVIFTINPRVRSDAYNSPYETAILKQINIARQNSGKPPVKPGYCIDQQAESWAHYLGSTNSFYHQSMNVIIDNCGGRHVGEIMGTGDATPREFRRLWMHSPAHKRVMLGNFSKAGVSAVPTRAGMVVVVDFIEY